MKISPAHLRFNIAILLLSIFAFTAAQIVPVGSGSYTKTRPGTDAAGRNAVPPGTPQLSGNALNKPVPTNDWWSTLIQSDHAGNLFNYPIAMKTRSDGLMMTYIPSGVLDDQNPIIIGVEGLNSSRTTVSDYSDWTVTMDWGAKMTATSGIGMPFVYFQKGASEVAKVVVNLGNVTVLNEVILVTDARNGADFAVFAPEGSSWTANGSTYTSTLNGENYWSVAMLPQENSNPQSVVETYKQYAYVFPVNTTATWNYDESTSTVRTDFLVETSVKEGAGTEVLMGLLPHQWGYLADDSPTPSEFTYNSIRGELKTLKGNAFSTERTFHGILPTLPYLSNYSQSFNPAALKQKVGLLENEGLATWTDSYNEGQSMNRLIQTARIADKIGETESRDKILATIKERLEDWLTAEGSEVAFLFYYNTDWTAMLGYPAGHGQDGNLNDHHFHWGYFIHAAAFLEQFEPGWAANWGEMINLLIRDAASPYREDPLFPFLRNFSPYAGHCWANGFASFPQGNDQESTSESMQFNSSLIHWGEITGNKEIRDLGIYLYTTEQTAIEEYWFDMNDRVFRDGHPYSLVSRVWGNSYDNGTFWTADIEASYGIELYPIHGGSMYLGHNTTYASKLWAEIENNTGILSNDDNVNLWHDIMWMYLAFTDPQKAIDLYDSYPDRNLKFGVSDAQTYYWLHAMNAMGRVDSSITSDHAIAVVFQSDEGPTYVAHNYTAADITVNFSDGYSLPVAPFSMATSRDASISGTIQSSFPTVYPGGSVELSVSTDGGAPDKVEFYKDGELLGEVLSTPIKWKAEELNAGVYNFYAKLYIGDDFNVTNIVSVVSGSQEAYSGTASPIPGTIDAGHYDVFQGGSGQGIAYQDHSPGNAGDFRTDEDVDASSTTSEGAIVGYIADGEWLEYTIDVQQSGYYDLSFRYASGNQAGGGPMHLELNGVPVSSDIYVSYTGDWDTWQSKSVSQLPLHKGKHILRVALDHGEFNLGRMTFAFNGQLPYGHPIADAGANVTVISPASTAQLDGSLSSDSDNDPLSYAWEQINGPSVIEFSDASIVSPAVSGLEKGIYTCRLTVSDGTYSSFDDVFIMVSATGNIAPTVSISSPSGYAIFEEGTTIAIEAAANDLEGPVAKVEFYDSATKLGEDAQAPFSFSYANATIGEHLLVAVATDQGGATGTSDTLKVSVVEVQECASFYSTAQQGSFSTGYNVTYRTVGTNVTITFELLDSDKNGVVAYLWRESPFGEEQMNHVEGNTFSFTLRNVTPGTPLSYACKFAFAGGLAVTRYVGYQSGTECEDTTVGLKLNTIRAVSIYPNPVSGSVNIEFSDKGFPDQIRLIDLTGTVLQQLDHPGEPRINWDLSMLTSGIYLMQFDYPEGPVFRKIVKR